MPSISLTNLVAYWSLDEASGTRNDSHGTNHLNDSGAVGSAVGIVGTAASFVAADSDSLSIADNADLSLGANTAFSIALWAKLTTDGTFFVLSKTSSSTGDEEYRITNVGPGGGFQFRVKNGAEHVGGVGEYPVTVGLWHFVVAWHDPDDTTINVQTNNGTVLSMVYSGGTAHYPGTNFQLGSFLGAGGFYDGLQDEASFWKRVLLPTERTWLYNSGNGRSYPDIVAEAGGGATGKPAGYYARQRGA